MVQRCTNPNDRGWKNYGGRGIAIEDRGWLQFENFLADMGEPPPGLTLERRDNDRGYCKANCVWATTVAQRHNRRDSKQ
jgi:hypothetical protein